VETEFTKCLILLDFLIRYGPSRGVIDDMSDHRRQTTLRELKDFEYHDKRRLAAKGD